MSLRTHPVVNAIRESLVASHTQAGATFYGWKLSVAKKQLAQTLMLGDPTVGLKPYQQRSVEDLSYTLFVYARHGDHQGVGNITLDPLQPYTPQIEQAFSNAQLASNPPWDLAQPSDAAYAEVQTADPLLVADLAGAHRGMQQDVAAKAATAEGVNINSAELFTTLTETYMETATGISASKQVSDIYFEIALEKLPLPNTEEVLQYKKALSIADANLGGFIDDAIAEALDIGKSNLPDTQDNATILVDKHCIAALLEALESQLNAQAEYQKGPHLLQGDLINTLARHPDSDALTVTLDPFLPVMACSTPFTGEGIPAEKGIMIERNVVKHQAVDSRMAAYLDRNVNAVCGNLVVSLGSASKNELIAQEDDCIEIVAFSSLLVNDSTLTWSSEIKLAKHYRQGKLLGMIKGGVVSGNIRENFSHFALSNESAVLNNIADAFSHALGYVGPSAMLIKAGVKIAGK